jgi:ABC-type dipeptide/oligopeptide/nickel transport system permease subunit
MIFAVTFLVTLTFLAFFADYLPFIPYPDDKIPGGARYGIGPGWEAWFGTEKLSRDVFARCIYGAKYTLQIGVYATVIGMVTGGFLGVVAGYYRGVGPLMQRTFVVGVAQVGFYKQMMAATTALSQAGILPISDPKSLVMMS